MHSRTQIYCWINEVKRGRTDLNNIASPRREPDEGLAGVIAAKLDADPHLSAGKLAQSLGIAVSTVCRYLTEVLGMKCRHLRSMPHMLTAAQKVVRVELAQRMLQALAKHNRSHFHFLFTADESWIFYTYNSRTIWVESWDDAHRFFFNGTGDDKMAILPPGQKMNGTYFMEYVLGPLTEVCYPESTKSHERRVMVHFGNAPIHNTGGVQEQLTNLGFTRMEHPPDSPDLAPCDFYLFGAMKENFSGQRFERVDELFFAVEAFLGGLSAHFLRTVFLEWERRLRVYCESRAEYVK
jgi:AraC-like DNA-binding protein